MITGVPAPSPVTVCPAIAPKLLAKLEIVCAGAGKGEEVLLIVIIPFVLPQLGFVNDKDLFSVLPLFPKEAVYYFTKASVPRALDENILKTKAEEYRLHGKSYPDVKSAVAAARTDASATDMIFIGGSTFIVADAL